VFSCPPVRREAPVLLRGLGSPFCAAGAYLRRAVHANGATNRTASLLTWVLDRAANTYATLSAEFS